MNVAILIVTVFNYHINKNNLKLVKLVNNYYYNDDSLQKEMNYKENDNVSKDLYSSFRKKRQW